MTLGATPDFNGSGRRGLSLSLPRWRLLLRRQPHFNFRTAVSCLPPSSSSHFPGLGSSSSPLPPPARPPPHQLTSVRRLSIFAEIRLDSRLRFLLLRTRLLLDPLTLLCTDQSPLCHRRLHPGKGSPPPSLAVPSRAATVSFRPFLSTELLLRLFPRRRFAVGRGRAGLLRGAGSLRRIAHET